MSERQRIQQVYAARAERLAGRDIDSLGNPAHLFAIQSRQRAIVRRLQQEGLWPLAGRDVLEVGCGSGGVLLELLSYGAEAGRLHGTDLLAERAAVARRHVPQAAVTCADGGLLPYPTATFDLLLQFTVFSSILDKACLLYTSPSPRDGLLSRMPSSA